MVPRIRNQGITMRLLLTALLSASLLLPAAASAATGYASFYKSGYRTANGERYNPQGFTAAHRNLPFGTKLQVTNLRNGKSVIVRINDRGPFHKKRVLDLSYGAAKAIGLHRAGIGRISFVVLK
jgi:rare lipoprotein A